MSMPMLPFDDRDGFVWYDGRLIPWRDAKLHVLTHGLHYASCVFEGEPAYFAPEARAKGIKMLWSRWARPAPHTAPVHAKASGLYMICTMAKHEAEAQGCDDALMLDWRGNLAEGTGANLFLAINGELHTPTPDCFLNGITRQTVIGLAKARGIKVVERAILPQELAKADEMFLTGSAAEVTPVGEIIGSVGHYRFTPGALCRLMWEDFDRAVGKQVATAAA